MIGFARLQEASPQTAARLSLSPERTPIQHREVEVPDCDTLLVLGAESARSAAAQFSGTLLILELELGKIATLLEEPWSGEERVEMHLHRVGEPLDHLLEPHAEGDCQVVSSPGHPALEELLTALRWADLSASEYRVFHTNFSANLQQLPRSGHWRGLVGKFRDVPAIICGAGASLDRTPIRGGLVIAAGSSLCATRAHLAVGVDPNYPQLQRALMHSNFEVPLLYRPRMYHEAVALHHGPLLYLSGENGHPIARHVEERLGLQGPEIEEGYSVTQLAIEVARHLGCAPIILAGVDLALEGDAAYAAAVQDPGVEDERIMAPGRRGEPVTTLRKWVTEGEWLGHYASRYPLYDASGEGLRVDGLRPFDLTTLPCLDLDERVTEQVLAAPAAASQAAVEQFRAEIRESLDRCKTYGEDPLSQFEREQELAVQLEATEEFYGA